MTSYEFLKASVPLNMWSARIQAKRRGPTMRYKTGAFPIFNGKLYYTITNQVYSQKRGMRSINHLYAGPTLVVTFPKNNVWLKVQSITSSPETKNRNQIIWQKKKRKPNYWAFIVKLRSDKSPLDQEALHRGSSMRSNVALCEASTPAKVLSVVPIRRYGPSDIIFASSRFLSNLPF